MLPNLNPLFNKINLNGSRLTDTNFYTVVAKHHALTIT